MTNFDPRFYYFREAAEWVPKARVEADGGSNE